jgi:transposase
LKERYPRVARYYHIEYNEEKKNLSYHELKERKEVARKLDGCYLLKTDKDMEEEEIWRTYTLLTRAEAAFRAMKSPLSLRPIFHQVEQRVQSHIFLCILAYHLLVAIEKMMLSCGVHTSWQTLREILSTHQIVTIVLPTKQGDTLRIRRATRADKEHLEIYKCLGVDPNIIHPIKTWDRC